MQRATKYTAIRQALAPLPLDAVVAAPLLYTAVKKDLQNLYGKKLGNKIFEEHRGNILRTLLLTSAVPVAITGTGGYAAAQTLKKATKSKTLLEALKKIKKGKVKAKNLKGLLWQLPLLASAEILAALFSYKQFKKLERKLYGKRKPTK